MRGFYNSQLAPNQPRASTDFLTQQLYRKKGGRAESKAAEKFEGTAKDERQDKKLAKKHHMSFDQWEKSDMDKKHDEQQSMEGLKRGGRAHRAKGGKTTVNIMIDDPRNRQQGPNPMQAAALAAMLGKGAPGGPGAMPPPPPPAGAPPMGAPPMAPPMAAPPQMPPQGAPEGQPPIMRKDGGTVKPGIQVPYKKPGRTPDGYPKMDFGSGTGFGRKQKVDAYGLGPTKSKNNY